MASKKKLEIALSKINMGGNDYKLQQYPTPPHIAAELLWFAFMNGDIEGKMVADFGAGNGIFAIGSKILGAKKVYAVEIDRKMMEICKKNAGDYGIEFVLSDINDFNMKVDTVIMNPPFGRKPFHRDRFFLKKAFELCKKIYSIHTANSFEFLRRFAEENGFKCEKLKEFDFPLKYSYKWHRKPMKNFRAAMLMFSKLPTNT